MDMRNENTACRAVPPQVTDRFLSLVEVYSGGDAKIMRAGTVLGQGYLITSRDDNVWDKSPGDYILYQKWEETVEALHDRDICLKAMNEADLSLLER